MPFGILTVNAAILRSLNCVVKQEECVIDATVGLAISIEGRPMASMR